MNKRQTMVIIRNKRPHRRTSINKALKRLGKLTRFFPLKDPSVGEVFDYVSFACDSWLAHFQGKRVDAHCVPECQNGTALEAALVARDPHALIVSYTRSGEFDQRGAEKLLFNHVVGSAGRVQAWASQVYA
jgi:hypothetical protein